MLKIKDSVDLKELEKYGFKELDKRYDNNNIINISKIDRVIDLYGGYTFHHEGIEIIYDLIKDDLVEKIGGEE